MNLYEGIKTYIPVNEQETRDKEIMLKHLASGEDCVTRENLVAHFTASIWIVNKDCTKTLMVYHNLYDSWSWIGGHADENEALTVKEDENSAVKWWAFEEALKVSKEPWFVEHIYKKLIEKCRKLG